MVRDWERKWEIMDMLRESSSFFYERGVGH